MTKPLNRVQLLFRGQGVAHRLTAPTAYDRGRVPFETRNTEVRGSQLPTLERRSGLKRQNNNKKEMEEQTKARREGRELISVADGYVFSWVDL